MLFPPKSKFNPNRHDRLAVEHLGGLSKDLRLLDLDMVRIKLLEA